MIIDGRTELAAGSKLAADVCIVGAGAAGITLALALADSNLDVLVLESGGLEPEPAAQDLARGESVGQQYVPLESARMRMFGGSTMHWGGWCRPLEPIDFEAREWVPYSGWPITRAALDPYYPRAQEICQLGEFAYEPDDWRLPQDSILRLPGGRIHSKLIQFSPPTRFGVRYREPLMRAKNVRVCLHSNVVQLVPAENGRTVNRVEVATFGGGSFEVSARSYMLATGGIDNARLLLASNRVLPAGVANDNDMVGRFFADHMQLPSAGLFPAAGRLDLALYQLSSRDVRREPKVPGGKRANLMAYLTLDRQVQESRRTLHYSANLFETTWSDYFTAANSAGDAHRAPWDEIGQSVQNLWHNLDAAVESAFGSGQQPIFEFITTQEQAPNPSSRVLLANERDPFGMARARLDWRLTDLDRHSIEVALDEFARAFGATSAGKINGQLKLREYGWPQNIPISWHHCGTTRMSNDPKQGVVDANGRAHGVENLYITGSSIFPTNGNGNPTLSIVALALRAADHLKEVLQ